MYVLLSLFFKNDWILGGELEIFSANQYKIPIKFELICTKSF